MEAEYDNGNEARNGLISQYGATQCLSHPDAYIDANADSGAG